MRSGSDRLDDDALRTTLRDAGLRCTDARLAVYREVARAAAPVAHRDVADALPELDRITVFRNLVALVEAGLAIRVDLGDRGIGRWGAGLRHRLQAHGGVRPVTVRSPRVGTRRRWRARSAPR